MTSWIVRDPAGVPIAQRYSNGNEYYYLFDGQGDVVALEDPGMVVASYDYCPTGNEADLGGGTNPMTAAGLGNPLRQGGVAYDDGTKDYMGTNGVITEDYSGTGTQTPAIANGDCMSGGGAAEGGGSISAVAAASTGGGGGPTTVTETVKGDCGLAQLSVTNEGVGGFATIGLRLESYQGPIRFVRGIIGWENKTTTSYASLTFVQLNQSLVFTATFEDVYIGVGETVFGTSGRAIVVPFGLPVLAQTCTFFVPYLRIGIT